MFRAAIFLPQVMSGVVIGVIWTWIYATNGSLNEFLRCHRPRCAGQALAR